MINHKKNLRTGQPLWLSLPQARLHHEALTRDMSTDIVIIGAGITGAMAAESLSAQGFKVILLDRRGPLKGSTSATTALLQYDIDQPLTLLSDQIGHAKATRAWRRSKLALESLAAKIQSLGIMCEPSRLPSLYLAGNVLDAEGLKKECEARNAIGLCTDYLTRNQLLETYGIRRSGALMSYDNLAANPLKLAGGFFQKALENGAEIFSPVIVENIESSAERVHVHTKNGYSITANHAIYATGYEIPGTIHTRRHSIHSTFAIATKPQKKNLWPGGCHIWEASDPYLYMRTTPDGRVICGGEDEEYKSEEERDALLTSKTKALEKKLKECFPQLDTKAEFAWCGSFGASVTGLPTIGAVPGMKHCYAIMAFGGNGITFSRLAAEILTAELTGKQDPDADLFAFA